MLFYSVQWSRRFAVILSAAKDLSHPLYKILRRKAPQNDRLSILDAEGARVTFDREHSCCFTGHRPQKLPWGMNEDDPRCLALKREIAARLDAVYELGYRRFLCGMAIGCDMYFAEAVLALREKYGDVTLEAAIPFGDQPGRWSQKLRLRYNKLIDSADQVTVLQYGYTPDCMMRRNRYMVDHASLLLACYDGRPGGTMNTILYAERNEVKVLVIEIET